MLLKIDVQKAYDRLKWSFIKIVLLNFGFLDIFINWIMQCVSTPKSTILLNSSPYSIVSLERGLRQGDPISPYLSILCNKVLSSLIAQAEISGSLNGIKISLTGPSFTHLAFADDVLLCGHATQREAFAFQDCLNTCCQWSCQRINQEKSDLFFNKNFRSCKARELANLLGFHTLSGCGRYLGLPILFSNSKKRTSGL